MNKNIKNLEASVHARLLKISKANKREFNSILIQYFQERFLYRLSLSEYNHNFVLKGALMLIVLSEDRFRPTKDIDFLGTSISTNEGELLEIFKEICKIEYNDGVSFDDNTITIEEINKDGDYNGHRIKIKCFLGNLKINIFYFGGYINPI